jgi:hypothetical protein
MQMNIGFPQTVKLKEMIQVRNHRVRTLRGAMGFVHEVVHLLREPLTADAKQTQFPRCQEIHGAWLEGITRQVHLLGKVKTVVHGYTTAAGSAGTELCDFQFLAGVLGIIHHCLIQRPFFFDSGQMVFVLLQACTV